MGMGIHGEWQTRNDSLTIRECHSPNGKGNDHRWYFMSVKTCSRSTISLLHVQRAGGLLGRCSSATFVYKPSPQQIIANTVAYTSTTYNHMPLASAQAMLAGKDITLVAITSGHYISNSQEQHVIQ